MDLYMYLKGNIKKKKLFILKRKSMKLPNINMNDECHELKEQLFGKYNYINHKILLKNLSNIL